MIFCYALIITDFSGKENPKFTFRCTFIYTALKLQNKYQKNYNSIKTEENPGYADF